MIVWITRTIRYVYYITNYGISLKNFVTIITCILPELLMITIPISAFISVIFVYNKMTKNNELIILQSSGVRKINCLVPVLFSSIFVLILSYSITIYLMQRCSVAFENTKQSTKNDAIKVLFNNTNFNTFQNITIYAKDRKDNVLDSIILYIKATDKNDFNRIIYAKSGKIVDTNIVLQNGNIQQFKSESNHLRTIYFDKYTINMLEYYSTNESRKIDFDLMSIRDLLKYKNNPEAKVELTNRLITPILSVTLSILACMLTLDISFNRGENNKDIAKVYLLCLVNFACYIFCVRSGKKNVVLLYLGIISLFTPFVYPIISMITNKIKLKHV